MNILLHVYFLYKLALEFMHKLCEVLYLRKGFIQVFIGISLCFIAPITISQAFNNQDHPFFLIVLIIGTILLVSAIYFGYKGINNLLNGTLGPKDKLN